MAAAQIFISAQILLHISNFSILVPRRTLIALGAMTIALAIKNAPTRLNKIAITIYIDYRC